MPDKEKTKDQYIGPSQVLDIVEQEGESSLGSKVVKVMFHGDQHPIIMTDTLFKLLVNEKTTDYDSIQKIKYNIIIPLVIQIMEEYGVEATDVESLLAKINNTIIDRYDRAANFLWNDDDTRWTPGMGYNTFIPLLEAEQIIKSIPKKNDTSNPTEKSGGTGEATPKGD